MRNYPGHSIDVENMEHNNANNFSQVSFENDPRFFDFSAQSVIESEFPRCESTGELLQIGNNGESLGETCEQKIESDIDKKMRHISSAFLDQYGLVNVQLSSYNYAIEENMPKIINNHKSVYIADNSDVHQIKWSNLYFQKPSHKEVNDIVVDVTPKMCEDRSMTYSSDVYIDAQYVCPSGTNTYVKKYLGEIPVMVGSVLCNLTPHLRDPYKLASMKEDVLEIGGYFIIKGGTKYIVPQVKQGHNHIHTFQGKATSGKVGSTNTKPKFTIFTETRSGSPTSYSSTTQVGVLAKSELIDVTMQYIDSCTIPVGIMFKALGVVNEADIVNFIFQKEWFTNPPTVKHKNAVLVLIRSLEQSFIVKTQQEALNYIGKKGKRVEKKNPTDITGDDVNDVAGDDDIANEDEIGISQEQNHVVYATNLIRSAFLPHIGIKSEHDLPKVLFLGYMVRKLLLCFGGIVALDDRDHFGKKSIHGADPLLTTQFYKAFSQLSRKIMACMENDIKSKKPVNVASYISFPQIITNSLSSAISANKWNCPGSVDGISQTLEIFNRATLISSLRKFVIPMKKDVSKIEAPRHLKGSLWGIACVTGDTMVSLPFGKRVLISTIQNGDVITTINPVTLEIEDTKVYNCFSKMSNGLLSMIDDSGQTIKCTLDHPFLIDEGDKTKWTQAKDLDFSSKLICFRNKVSVKKIISFDFIEDELVYDFTTVSDNHSFVANGFITHNCPSETPEGKSVGLVLHSSMGMLVTIGTDPIPVFDILATLDITLLPTTILPTTVLSVLSAVTISTDISRSNPPDSRVGLFSTEAEGDTSKFITYSKDFLNNTRVFLNGKPIGHTTTPTTVVKTLVQLRRRLSIVPGTSISYDTYENEIRISTESNRVARAVVVLDDEGNMKLTGADLDSIARGEWCSRDKSTWMALLEQGYVEILSKDEEEFCNVAIYPSDLEAMIPSVREKYTHCEMSPDMFLGSGVSTSPYNHCNQAPRNIYQAAMAKQAVGVPGTNNQYKRKGKWHTMVYPQKPICSSFISKKMGFDAQPLGQNATVVVMPLLGMNQEDSLIMSNAAVDRGFMCTYYYVSYEAILKNVNMAGSSKCERFEIPNDNHDNYKKLKTESFNKLKQRGRWCFVPCGTEVIKGDALIGMTETHVATASINADGKKAGDIIKTNVSICYDHKWPATVHSVKCGHNGEGYAYIKLVTRQYRKPVLGDKFSGCHGQKGVVGVLLDHHTMPFIARLGYTPNICINPLAFPSRMTIGMLIEGLVGTELCSSALKCPEYHLPLILDYSGAEKEGCVITEVDPADLKYPEKFNPETDYESGITGDATPFDKKFDVHRIIDAIKKMGINGFSEEEMVYPKTGEKIRALIFSGVIYYQRLKHMVVDKIHARANGSKHILTQQPTEGRKKKGGFRTGTMEKDAISSDTRIALREGISVQLGTIGKHFEDLWGYTGKGMTKSKQIGFDDSGMRSQYIITLQDGRQITSAAKHPFLVCFDVKLNDFWMQAQKLTEGVLMACSVDTPLANFEEEMKACKEFLTEIEWDNEFFSEIHISQKKNTRYEIFRKSLALARLVGLAVTDGHAPLKENSVHIFLGHTLGIESALEDIYKLTGMNQKYKRVNDVCYTIRLPKELADEIRHMGIIIGAKVHQNAYFPKFVNERTPLPILREFLGGLYGGDGHTLSLSKHRDKTDLMKSVGISWTRDEKHIKSLQQHMKNLQGLLLRFGIESTVGAPKLTTNSKESNGTRAHKEILLNIPLTHLIQFAEKIGFRYCEHKSLKLSAGVSYRRFREGVIRQKLWIMNRVEEITNYKQIRAQFGPKKLIRTKEAIDQACAELSEREAILHETARPERHVLARFLNGEEKTTESRDPKFPHVGEYLKEIGAIDMFLDEDYDPITDGSKKVMYGMSLTDDVLPLHYLKIIRVEYKAEKVPMYDIQVEGTESFLANGVVAHNCMLAQGIPEMVLDRLLYQSDVFVMPVCQICGIKAIDDGINRRCGLCQKSKIVDVQLPYGTKLLTDEFNILGFVPRMLTLNRTMPTQTANPPRKQITSAFTADKVIAPTKKTNTIARDLSLDMPVSDTIGKRCKGTYAKITAKLKGERVQFYGCFENETVIEDFNSKGSKLRVPTLDLFVTIITIDIINTPNIPDLTRIIDLRKDLTFKKVD